jgi:hypothetical protein
LHKPLCFCVLLNEGTGVRYDSSVLYHISGWQSAYELTG